MFRPTLPASRRILDDLYAQLAAVVDGDGDGEDGTLPARRTLTADLLRRLDEDPASTSIPTWLHDADEQAQAELVAWYAARCLPGPYGADDQDPGEPIPGDTFSAYGHLIERPSPETPERHLIEYLKCRRDLVYFIDSYCWLAHPEQGVIPFRLWRWQAWLVWQWQRHTLNITLKARQEGVSELAAATALHLVRFHDTKTALLLSRGEEEAKVLKGRAELMYANLPPWLQANPEAAPDSVRPGTSNMTVFALVHVDSRRRERISRIESLPATKGAGRSRTAALVVFDEHAHMLWAEEIWAAAKPTADAGGRILSISSANGLGNFFADLWYAATTTPGGAGLFAVFLSWRRHPQRDAAWYAAQLLLAEKSNRVPLLHQEYPSEPGEAFVQSGRPVFDQKVLVAHEMRIREEVAAGFTPYQPEQGGLTLYEPPVGPYCDLATRREREGYHYILSADVAEGLAHGDWDDASVLCRETGDEVATLHGHWPPHIYAQKLDALGWMYNTALLVVERNSIGNTVLTALVTGEAHKDPVTLQPQPYPNLYHHQEPLVAGKRPEPRPGWPTNVTTKPLAIHALGAALAEGSYKPRDMAALTELRIFRYNDNGSMSAPSGKHDDRVMSRAPGVYLLSQPDPVQSTLDFISQWAQLTEQQVAAMYIAQAPGGMPGSTLR